MLKCEAEKFLLTDNSVAPLTLNQAETAN